MMNVTKYFCFKLHKGRNNLQDYFQFHIFAYNHIGMCFTIVGYGFTFYFDTNELEKKNTNKYEGQSVGSTQD